jgi:polysaccharide chain length determinant protein (PEP-CTERM system associated)
MWRRRWLGIAVAWCVAVIGGVAVYRVVDQFEAVARISIDTQSLLNPLMTGLAVQTNVEQRVALVSRTLISRPNIEKLITMADLDPGDRPNAQLIDDLAKRLSINTAGRDNLYVLSYRDPNPERAKNVVDSLTTIFVESHRGHNREDSAEAKHFIEQQIASYEKRLEEAEARLKEFRLRHLGQSTPGTDYFARLEELKTRLNDARLELREAENSRDALKRQIAGEDPVLSGAAVEVSEIDTRIDALKGNLDSLLQRYTEQHPDVAGTRRVIAELEEQKRKDAALRDRTGASKPVTASTANPVYQQLRVSLAAAEATASSLRTRVQEYEDRYQQLKNSARMAPEIEAQLAQLNRDYEVNRRNYEALVARRESAAISTDMESKGSRADLNIVDPPRVSSGPVGPGRPVLMVLALLGALAAGAAASFGASRAWPMFFDAESLRQTTGLPVLGSVSLHVNPQSRRRLRLGHLGFFSAFVALLIAHGAAVAFIVATSRLS